jgi:sortase A
MTFAIGFLRLAQTCLYGLAAASLGYYGYCIVETASFQHRQEARLAGLLDRPDLEYPVAAANHHLMGRLQIPRLKVSAIVVAGTSEEDLKLGIGHIAGTNMPGTPGNVGLAGHRDTFFRPLRNIRQQDKIQLTTLEGEFHYRVVSTQIVPPTGVGVLAPGDREVLTLVTCYPFFLLGTAPDRFIVRAERVH